MKPNNQKKSTSGILFLFLLLLAGMPDGYATEWSAAQIIGPAVRSRGASAITYGNTLFLFATVDGRVRYRRSEDGHDWSPADSWTDLEIETAVAPAAAVFLDQLLVFYRTSAGTVAYRVFNGTSWTSTVSTGLISETAVTTCVHNKQLKLFTVQNGQVVQHTFHGTTWSEDKKYTGLTTAYAPSAVSYEGRLYLFITAKEGFFAVWKSGSYVWLPLGCLDCPILAEGPVSAVLSNGKILLFTTSRQRLLMRIIQSDEDKERYLPEDDWMDVGAAVSGVTAAAQGRRIFLFFESNSGVPGALPTFHRTVGLAFQYAEWTDVPLAVIQVADTDCTHTANISKVSRWIRYANLVYAPLLINFTRSVDKTVCNTFLQGDSFIDTEARNLANSQELKGKVTVIFRGRAGGGGFSGAGTPYVAMPEYMSVCTSKGTEDFAFFNNDLAHEIGHYFGLPHTFHDNPHFKDKVPASKGALDTLLQTYNYDLTAAFDRDLEEAGVTDTPLDPHYESGGISRNKCTEKETPIYFIVNGQKVPVIPPRTNVMSYYQLSGMIVNKLSPGQRAVIYRYLRAKLNLGYL